MDKRVTERVDKFNIIGLLCSSNPSIVDSLPAFKAGMTYLNAENAAIKQLMKPLLLPTTGEAEAKRVAKLKAASLLDPICGALMGYADAIQSPEIKAAANFTESILARIRDEEMTQTCYALIDLANGHIDALKDYGYTADDTKLAADAVAEFERYNPMPIETRSEDKAERGNLLQRSGTLNAYVGKQLKNIAKRFKTTEPEFHEKLMNAMRNQNRGIRHNITDEEKALRKAKRDQKAAEKAAAKASAKEAEAQARAAELNAQIEAMSKEATTEAQQPSTPTPGEQNGVPVQ
jgi:hypothetical protein